MNHVSHITGQAYFAKLDKVSPFLKFNI